MFRMMSQDAEQSTLAAFNAAPPEAAERDLLACCASRSFAKAIADGRPYPGPAALQAAVDAAFEALSWDDIVERIFGHVFVVCASGLSGQDMRDQLRARLGNDAEAERAVVRQELLKITRLRLAKLLSL